MSRTIGVEDASAVDECVEVLLSGGVAVVPTDTVYGVAASIDSPRAIGRLFTIKGRQEDKPMAVLVDSLQTALKLGTMNPHAIEAARNGWPGALTIIVQRNSGSLELELGGNPDTIGLRVPDHRFTREVLKRSGPVAASSANLTGEGVATSIEEARSTFGDAVDLYVDGGTLSSQASRVISCIGDRPEVLRE